MLDAIVLLRRWKYALWGLAVLVWTPVVVLGAEWPPVLPEKKLGNLPPGEGMTFFYGVWDQTSRLAGGGPMTVTESTIEFREASTPTISPYKVLYTGPNYVLFVTLDTFGSGTQWTTFNLFTVQSLGWPVNRERPLRSYSCIEYGYGTVYDFKQPGPFSWSKEKLLDTFKKSWCLREIENDGTVSITKTIGWSSNIFQRR